MISARSLPWLASIRGLLAVVCIAATCAWLGLRLAQTWCLPPLPTYRPDFGAARWIAPVAPEGRAFYRKQIYISGPVRRAWVLATAPDRLSIYVNNHVVSGENPNGSSPGVTAQTARASPTALVDITPYLKLGTNTVAVAVSSADFDMPGSLLLRGAIEYEMQRQDFVSDESWRAATYPSDLNNLLPWTDPALDDFHWPLARFTTFPSPSLIRPVPLPPQLLQDKMQARWICAFPDVARTAVFTRDFVLPFGVRDGWLQIASVGENMITLNGHAIAGSLEADQAMAAKAPGASEATQLHYYYIEPWLHGGRNHLSVRVDKFEESPALLAQVAYGTADGRYAYVPPNQDWRVANIAGDERQAIYLPTVSDAGATIAEPTQLSGPSLYLHSVYSGAFLKQAFWGVILGLGLFLAHLLVTRELMKRGGYDRPRAAALDALLHVPLLLALLVLQLLSYDAHLQPDGPQNPAWLWLIIALWAALRWAAIAELSRPRAVVREDRWLSAWVQGRGFILALACVTAFSFGLRLSGLNLFPLNADEIVVVEEAKGVWERGYPSLHFRDNVVRASTYELLPYPIALSALFFGWNDWAMRIPALLFGAFTTWNIGRMGRELFSSRVGLIASVLHAIIPIDVYWGRHCFHPAQDQFFGLLCLWSFYRAIREPGRLDPRQFMFTCLYFIGLYFSWEGAVFILPAFTFAMMALNLRRWGWLAQWPLYLGLTVVSTVVLLQLGARSIKIPGFLTIGLGLAEKGPGFVFLDPTANTSYYTSGVLIYPCHILLVLFFALGLFYLGRSRALRYVMFMFGFLLFLYSNFLPMYSNRYFFYYQILLILGASAMMVYLADTLRQWARGEWGLVGRQTARWCVRAAFAIVIMLACGDLGLRLVNALPQDATAYYGSYSPDYRRACRYVSDNFRPGDFVLGNLYYLYYGGRSPDVTANMAENARSIFDPKLSPFGAYEQISYRAVSVLTERDLVDVFSQGRRTWFIVDEPPPTGPDVIHVANEDYIAERSRLVYSSFQINIYLCDGMPTKANEAIPDLGLPEPAALSFTQTSPAYVQDSLSGILTPANPTVPPYNP